MEVAPGSLDSSNEAEFLRMIQLALAPLDQHNVNVDVSLDEDSSSIPFNEAEFRRKAWLALAPLYEATSSSNSGEITMVGNQDTDTQIESERSGESDFDEADAKNDFTPKHRHTKRTVEILKQWFADHEAHPYPTNGEKQELALVTGLTENQVKWWMEHRRNYTSRNRNRPRTRNRRYYAKSSTECLLKWYAEHETNPYPSNEEKQELATASGLSVERVIQWFTNKRMEMRRKSFKKIKKGHHLEEWFSEHESNPYPTLEQREELALITGLTENQVRIWFNQKRYRKGISKKYKRISNVAKDHLMKWYDENEANPIPRKDQVKELASITGVTEKCVRIWLGNERMKRKKAAANETIMSGETKLKA
eukprot:scaffold5215_cov51-Cyclotella_meneghiniana.AAC.3